MKHIIYLNQFRYSICILLHNYYNNVAPGERIVCKTFNRLFSSQPT